MTVAVLINGHVPVDRSHAIAFDDRGLQYGDGVFETARLTGGRIRFLDDHLARLEAGCERLQLPCPERAVLIADLATLTAGHGEGVIKVLLSRGSGPRGYRTARVVQPTRVIVRYPPPAADGAGRGITVRWCDMRLGRNARLAGIKHCNRLEQVLARAEWDDDEIADGLMLDTEGELVAATSANVFVVRDGVLATPDLRYCGIRGVLRQRILGAARAVGVPVAEEPLWPADVESAEEVFLSNAVTGIRPVTALAGRRWTVGPVTARLANALTLW